jgi:hypothetical protein
MVARHEQLYWNYVPADCAKNAVRLTALSRILVFQYEGHKKLYFHFSWSKMQHDGAPLDACDRRPHVHVRGGIQKFPDWPPTASIANGTALCHYVQLYRYFVSQSSEFCRHKPLCCFLTSVFCCCLFRYRLSPEIFGYILAYIPLVSILTLSCAVVILISSPFCIQAPRRSEQFSLS